MWHLRPGVLGSELGLSQAPSERSDPRLGASLKVELVSDSALNRRDGGLRHPMTCPRPCTCDFRSEIGPSTAPFFAAVCAAARSQFDNRVFSEAFGRPSFQGQPYRGSAIRRTLPSDLPVWRCFSARFLQSFWIDPVQFRPFSAPGTGPPGPDESASNSATSNIFTGLVDNLRMLLLALSCQR